jgi:hypothetical protein
MDWHLERCTVLTLALLCLSVVLGQLAQVCKKREVFVSDVARV